MSELRQKIVASFKGHEIVETELLNAEAGDPVAIANLENYLNIEMRKAPEFAKALQQLARDRTMCY